MATEVEIFITVPRRFIDRVSNHPKFIDLRSTNESIIFIMQDLSTSERQTFRNTLLQELISFTDMPSLRHAVRVGKKRKGSKKVKSFDAVTRKARSKGVRNPKAYAARIFFSQGVNPRTGKKTKKHPPKK